MNGKSARNEKRKLTAAFLNNLGVAFVIASFVGPLFAQGGFNQNELLYFGGLGFVLGALTHILARSALVNLED